MIKDFSKLFVINQKSNFTRICQRYQLEKQSKVEKNWHILKRITFNFWLFFKLIPLTNPSKVRYLVYYKKNFRNLRSKISSQPLFGLKLEKKSGFMILWLNKLHLFVININFTLIQMHFEVNNLFSCWTESKAALEKTFQEGRDLYGSSQFFQLFQQYFWSFTDYKHCEWSYFWFGRHLKHCVYQLAHN